MHKFLLKKAVPVTLVLSLLLSLVSFAAFAADEDPTTQDHRAFFSSEEQREAFDALPNTAVVCYMHGQPVYKYEVDENGFVHKDFSQPVTYASGRGATISTKHRYESICAGCTLTTTGFSQSENIVYLSKADAYKVLSGLDKGYTAVSIASDLCADSGNFYAQLVSILGNVISTCITETMDSMDAQLSKGNLVELDWVSSTYGQFASVYGWNGTTCVRYGYTENGVTVTVRGGYCKPHNASVWG